MSEENTNTFEKAEGTIITFDKPDLHHDVSQPQEELRKKVLFQLSDDDVHYSDGSATKNWM